MDFKEKKVPLGNSLAPQKVLRSMLEETWRPVTEGHPIKAVPPSLSACAARCCAHDPKLRPIMLEVLELLTGPNEVEPFVFKRVRP